MTPGKDTRVAILHPPRPKERHEQALGVGFRCLYVSQEVHTRLWLSNAQHSLDLQMEEGGLYVPCLQASAGATPHPSSYCTQEKSRKLNQGNQDGSLLPRMVPYFPAIGERAAVESISPLAAEEPATLLLPQVRSCPSYRGRPSPFLSRGRNPGLQIRGSIWQLGIGPTRGLCPKQYQACASKTGNNTKENITQVQGLLCF